ncbi:MAG: hypothetical protein ACOX5R_18830 [bacterium]|jgi:hypothetical protein
MAMEINRNNIPALQIIQQIRNNEIRIKSSIHRLRDDLTTHRSLVPETIHEPDRVSSSHKSSHASALSADIAYEAARMALNTVHLKAHVAVLTQGNIDPAAVFEILHGDT